MQNISESGVFCVSGPFAVWKSSGNTFQVDNVVVCSVNELRKQCGCQKSTGPVVKQIFECHSAFEREIFSFLPISFVVSEPPSGRGKWCYEVFRPPRQQKSHLQPSYMGFR